jgi:squalene synthase HpnC
MMRTSADSIERAREGENFPVASRLVARRHRPLVLLFYRFARLADDIADDPARAPDEKLAALAAMENALRDSGAGDHATSPASAAAQALAEACLRRGVALDHAAHLLQAFRRDAENRSCRSWSDLLLYCRYSANPVGRFLLELHDESGEARTASDALCSALQIINHLQDCAADWRTLRRCYLPGDWLASEGLDATCLDAPTASTELKRVLARALEGVARLLAQAAPLPALLADRRLASEAAGILALARRLARRLAGADPLRARPTLGKLVRAATFLGGAAPRMLRGGSRARRGSSFRFAMRLAPPHARQRITAVYRLARAWDDLADGKLDIARKRAAIAAWQRELARLEHGVPTDPLTRHLGAGWLPLGELRELLAGMAMDVDGPIHAPARETLRLYCRRVAGAVGVLVFAALERRDAAAIAYAEALGETLQLVNVLRDIDDDAAENRLYLAREWLAHAGLDPAGEAIVLVRDPRFTQARELLVATIGERFAACEALRRECRGAGMRPAIAMGVVYRRLFERLRVAPQTRACVSWRDHAAAVWSALRLA